MAFRGEFSLDTEQKNRRSLRGERYFRWRGRDVTRLENLSDIVFALSLTLIVASAVPATFRELASLWREAIAIAFSFALILLIWSKHHAFFRRYDLEDGFTVLINSIILFLIMIFAYPLKFMATFLVNFFTGYFQTPGQIESTLSLADVPYMLAVYAAGYALVFGLFALLYAHALRRSDVLELSEAERIMTRLEVDQGLAAIGVSVAAILLGFLLPVGLSTMAGGVYFVIGPIMGWLSSRARKRANAAHAPEGGTVS